MIKAQETYKKFAEIYDLYVSRFNSDFEFYNSYCCTSDRIVEIGCGTGRVLKELLGSGHSITGVDISQEMLDKASNKLQNWMASNHLKLLLHNFSFESTNETFDKALISFYTFNYIIDNPVKFLRNVHKSVNTNGMLMIDLFYPRPLLDESIDNKWITNEYTINNEKITIQDNRTMLDNIEYRQQIFIFGNKEIKIDTRRRYYSPDEIKKHLLLAGFNNIRMANGYDIDKFSNHLEEVPLGDNFIITAGKS